MEIIFGKSQMKSLFTMILKLPDGNYLGIAESIQNLSVPETGPWYGACIGMFGPQCVMAIISMGRR